MYSLILVLSECIFSARRCMHAWMDIYHAFGIHNYTFFLKLFILPRMEGRWGRGVSRYSFISKPLFFYFLSHPIDFTYTLPLLRTLTLSSQIPLFTSSNSSLQFRSLCSNLYMVSLKEQIKRLRWWAGTFVRQKVLVS